MKFLQKWLLPYTCCFCGLVSDQSKDLCNTCSTTLPWAEDRCYRCGRTLEGREEAIYCQACMENPPAFDRLCALFSYDLPVSHLITGLKFGRKLSFGRLLGELLAEKVVHEWYLKTGLPEAFLPVPLHISRLRKRGYNQALELSWPLKKKTKLPLLLNYCIRKRNTKPQSGISLDLRKMNLNNAFCIRKPMPFKHIAIIDDVVTSGSTVNALAKTVKKAGVEQVDVICICRA